MCADFVPFLKKNCHNNSHWTERRERKRERSQERKINKRNEITHLSWWFSFWCREEKQATAKNQSQQTCQHIYRGGGGWGRVCICVHLRVCLCVCTSWEKCQEKFTSQAAKLHTFSHCCRGWVTPYKVRLIHRIDTGGHNYDGKTIISSIFFSFHNDWFIWTILCCKLAIQ